MANTPAADMANELKTFLEQKFKALDDKMVALQKSMTELRSQPIEPYSVVEYLKALSQATKSIDEKVDKLLPQSTGGGSLELNKLLETISMIRKYGRPTKRLDDVALVDRIQKQNKDENAKKKAEKLFKRVQAELESVEALKEPELRTKTPEELKRITLELKKAHDELVKEIQLLLRS